MTDADRIAFIQEIYDEVFGRTITFNGAIGRDLPYLMGAIAHNRKMMLSPRSKLWRILCEAFGTKPGGLTKLMQFVEFSDE